MFSVITVCFLYTCIGFPIVWRPYGTVRSSNYGFPKWYLRAIFKCCICIMVSEWSLFFFIALALYTSTIVNEYWYDVHWSYNAARTLSLPWCGHIFTLHCTSGDRQNDRMLKMANPSCKHGAKEARGFSCSAHSAWIGVSWYSYILFLVVNCNGCLGVGMKVHLYP